LKVPLQSGHFRKIWLILNDWGLSALVDEDEALPIGCGGIPGNNAKNNAIALRYSCVIPALFPIKI
jgi:hypothetical protein